MNKVRILVTFVAIGFSTLISKADIKENNIPFKETENYVKRVKSNYKAYKRIYADINFEDRDYDSAFINYIYKLKSLIGKGE